MYSMAILMMKYVLKKNKLTRVLDGILCLRKGFDVKGRKIDGLVTAFI